VFDTMPSLFRFLFVVGGLSAIVIGGLVAAGVYLEPEQRDITHPVYGVKIDRQ